MPIPEQSEVVAFNNFVPRLGATYDLTGEGKTVLKANWGRFYFNTGVSLADAINPNTGDQYADWNWTDRNNDRIYQEGEETTLITRFGGVANASIDPEPGELLHRRGVGLRRARGDRGPRRARRLRLQEGQQRLAAVQRRPSVRGLQRARHPSRPGSGQRRRQRRRRPGPEPVQPGRHDAGLEPGDDEHPWLRGHLQDARVLGQQALRQPLVDGGVLLLHLDHGVRPQLLRPDDGDRGEQLLVRSAATRRTRTRRR